MDEAEILCDRVAIVDRGKVIALGTPRELIASLGAEHVVEFALEGGGDDLPSERLRQLPGVEDVRREGASWALTTSRVHEVVPALLASLGDSSRSLVSLATHHATLEDVFVTLTGRHLRDA
jgi:ABC-2 type transport system ATP-binding protein